MNLRKSKKGKESGVMDEVKELETRQFLVFRLDKEEYGVDITKITTIIEKDMAIARVPDTPDYIKGVINLRGEIIPIMDLRTKFGLPPVEDNENTRIIIIKVDDIVLGLIVDSVAEVIQLGDDDIENITNFSSDLSLDYIYGVGKVGNRIVTILKLDKLISL